MITKASMRHGLELETTSSFTTERGHTKRLGTKHLMKCIGGCAPSSLPRWEGETVRLTSFGPESV